jgi:hypothetical protein
MSGSKMEAIGKLTGGVAHDFNNLLTTIIGNLDLLADDNAGNSAARQRLETILHASERGAELTRQMLAFSRRQPLQPKRVDVNRLLDSTTRLLSRTLGENVTVKLLMSSDLWAALVDEWTAVMNIAINARDAMPEGGTLFIGTYSAEIVGDFATLTSQFHQVRMWSLNSWTPATACGPKRWLGSSNHSLQPSITIGARSATARPRSGACRPRQGDISRRRQFSRSGDNSQPACEPWLQGARGNRCEGCFEAAGEAPHPSAQSPL